MTGEGKVVCLRLVLTRVVRGNLCKISWAKFSLAGFHQRPSVHTISCKFAAILRCFLPLIGFEITPASALERTRRLLAGNGGPAVLPGW